MSLDQPKVLVIEDEPAQVEMLRYNLKLQNYEVMVATDGETGVEKARDEQPDIILLDWMLPRLSGIEACRQIRRLDATRQIPVIMLTARTEERDRVRGLDIGADDYISKPYSIKELLARVRAALRRPSALVTGETLEFDKIKIDLSKHIVTIDDEAIHLGPTEYRLLITLMKSPGRVFSRDQLLDMVWGLSADVDTRNVDVHIGRLRRLLTDNNANNMIRTVRGYGYSVQGN